MIQDEHNPEGTDHAAQGHALAAGKATPPAIHRITPENPPQFPCWVFDYAKGDNRYQLWWYCRNAYSWFYAADGDDTHWCQSPKRPTVTPDAPTPPAPTPALPPEVVEAIRHHCCMFGLHKGWETTESALHKLGIDLEKALAPLWPRPAPVTADAPTPPALPPEVREAIARIVTVLTYERGFTDPDPKISAEVKWISDRYRELKLSMSFEEAAHTARAEWLSRHWPRPAAVTADALRLAGEIYGILINRHDEVMHQPETGKVKVAAVLAPVLARLKDLEAAQDKHLLDRVEAAERDAAAVRAAWNQREPQLFAAERERDQLRAALASAKQEVERLQRLNIDAVRSIDSRGEEIADLRAQLADARQAVAAALAQAREAMEDKERLDWLEGGGFDQRVARTFNIWQGGGMKFRAAIDAARREGGAP